ncbi:MAG: DUF882 domain-containing protein [Alphaproteobacteria bacterium]|nr:DUF882 domain-containing protein [Alphaproteobacteria bacterium]
MTNFHDPSRRAFLGAGLAAVGCGIAAPALAAPRRLLLPKGKPRALSFYNLHTDEKLHVTYWKDGRYDRTAWGRINHILRDHYSGDTHVMDLRLIDLVHDLQTRLGNDRPVDIISGYRSPATNHLLRERGGGVAKHSYHMRGMAVDIRLDGTSLSHLHNTALAMRRGGVGYYPSSDFVHVDVGPVRRWG